MSIVCLRTIVGIATVLLIPVCSLLAQTRFKIVDSVIDVSRYTSVEECVALGLRLRKQYSVRQDTSRYSKPLGILPEFEPDPAIAIEWTRDCMRKFDPDTAPVDTTFNWMRTLNGFWVTGYVLARDFVSARAVRNRQLEVIPLDSFKRRSLYYDQLASIYRDYVRPIDLNMLDELDHIQFDALEHRGRDLERFSQRISYLRQQVARRWNYGQRDTARIMARELLRIIDSMDIQDDERAVLNQHTKLRWLNAIRYSREVLEYEEIRDSLRIGGPEAYERVKRKIWADAGGEPDKFPPPIGRPAIPITPEFFFRNPSDRGNRELASRASIAPVSIPKSDRVTLLVFLNNACRDGSTPLGGRLLDGGECWESYGVLRRIAARFPSLDVTVMTQTRGALGAYLTNDSIQEAELIRSLWHDYHKLPVNIGVSYTPFFRIQKPDNRRIDNPLEHIQYYFIDMFAPHGRRPGKNLFVIAPNRKILGYYNLDQRTESNLMEFLTPLMEWYDRHRH
jgi:hypothetical protein